MIVTASCHDKPMSTSTSLVTGLAAGTLLGILVGFLWAKVRHQSGALEITTLQQQLLAHDAQISNDANTIKTLNEQLATMVTNKITTNSGLAGIEGVGAARIDKYGERFLEVVCQALTEQSVVPVGKSDATPPA